MMRTRPAAPRRKHRQASGPQRLFVIEAEPAGAGSAARVIAARRPTGSFGSSLVFARACAPSRLAAHGTGWSAALLAALAGGLVGALVAADATASCR